ncbi:MAG TPA: quinolinate synthase [Spirochaetales bacterium]|nr:quinolinate synthase [Spirochaetales bacterium]
MNATMTDDLDLRIKRLKESLGGRVSVPAHHYQRPDIVRHADLVGDSYRLAVAASRSEASYIILCGVRFMAESAAILARPDQRVLSPDLAAGCPMADMIDQAGASMALASLKAAGVANPAPVVYMNSNADVKALAGSLGGSVCTSSNASSVVKHYLDEGRPVFFAPDRNLAMNTARRLGLDSGAVFLVGKDGSIRGQGDPSRGLLFAWDGYCHVHRHFTLDQVRAARQKHPGARLIVHPECDPELVELSDDSGSTEGMQNAIRDGGPGRAWIVGTESNFVLRLASEYPDRTVEPLALSYCPDMSLITRETLIRSLESIVAFESGSGPLVHELRIEGQLRDQAASALRAMVDIVEGRS